MLTPCNRKPIKPPNLLLTLSEMPRTLAAPLGSFVTGFTRPNYPLGDGHPVLVIPGFRGTDDNNRGLINFLRNLNLNAVGWEQGRNLGHGLIDPQILVSRVGDLYREKQQKVSLIGHSLGGIYAREIAKLCPQWVRQVITLASPFGEGRTKASYLYPIYKRFSPHRGQDNDAHWAEAPPMPTTAIYSRSDGVLDWRVALQRDGHSQTENIEVYSCHNGMANNPAVWHVLADRLTQDADRWQPFAPRGWQQWLYPPPAWQPQGTKSMPPQCEQPGR